MPLKIDLGRCPLVLVGPWNQAIFVPDWVRDNVLKRDGAPAVMTLELLFAPRPVLTYGTPLVSLAVAEGQIAITPRAETDDAFAEMERCSVRILEQLPRTPLRGVGINMGFTLVGGADDRFAQLASLESGITKVGPVVSRALSWSIQYDSTNKINVSLSTGETDPLLDFNIDNDARTSDQALAFIRGQFGNSRALCEQIGNSLLPTTEGSV